MNDYNFLLCINDNDFYKLKQKLPEHIVWSIVLYSTIGLSTINHLLL